MLRYLTSKSIHISPVHFNITNQLLLSQSMSMFWHITSLTPYNINNLKIISLLHLTTTTQGLKTMFKLLFLNIDCGTTQVQWLLEECKSMHIFIVEKFVIVFVK